MTGKAQPGPPSRCGRCHGTTLARSTRHPQKKGEEDPRVNVSVIAHFSGYKKAKFSSSERLRPTTFRFEITAKGFKQGGEAGVSLTCPVSRITR